METGRPTKKSRTRQRLKDDDEDEEETKETGGLPIIKDEESVQCSRCKQKRFPSSWSKVASHRHAESADWQCNAGKDEEDKVDYCLFIMCTKTNHLAYGSKHDGGEEWRYCGDDHKERSNWLRVVQDAGHPDKNTTRIVEKIEKGRSLLDGWEKKWVCCTGTWDLCGLSNSKELRCSRRKCHAMRRFGSDDDLDWQLAPRPNVYNNGYTGTPIMPWYYGNALWQCGTYLTFDHDTNRTGVDRLYYEQRTTDDESEPAKTTKVTFYFCDF